MHYYRNRIFRFIIFSSYYRSSYQLSNAYELIFFLHKLAFIFTNTIFLHSTVTPPSLRTIPVPPSSCAAAFEAFQSTLNFIADSYQGNVSSIEESALSISEEQTSRLSALITLSTAVPQSCIDSVTETYNTSKIDSSFSQCIDGVDEQEIEQRTAFQEQLSKLQNSTGSCDLSVCIVIEVLLTLKFKKIQPNRIFKHNLKYMQDL